MSVMAAETVKSRSTEELIKPTEAADMEQFRATPYYQGLEIEALRQQLAEYQADDAALRQQAEAQYQPTYEAEREALRQQTERQIQGYDAQRAGVSDEYDRVRRQTQEAYDESAVNLGNALTRRGLGRSSLAASQGAFLERERNRALSDIDRDENQAISAINEKIALLTDQAAQSERTMAGSYARQLENRVNELKSQNQTAAISLQLQIAALQQQGYEAYQDWLLKNRAQSMKEKEFEMKYAGKGSSAGSSSGSKSGAKSGAKSAGSIQNDAKEIGKTGGKLGGALAALAGAVKRMAAGVSQEKKN